MTESLSEHCLLCLLVLHLQVFIYPLYDASSLSCCSVQSSRDVFALVPAKVSRISVAHSYRSFYVVIQNIFSNTDSVFLPRESCFFVDLLDVLRRATVESANPQFSNSMLHPRSKGKDFRSSASVSKSFKSLVRIVNIVSYVLS